MEIMFKVAITVLTVLNFKESCAGLKETMAEKGIVSVGR